MVLDQPDRRVCVPDVVLEALQQHPEGVRERPSGEQHLERERLTGAEGRGASALVDVAESENPPLKFERGMIGAAQQRKVEEMAESHRGRDSL